MTLAIPLPPEAEQALRERAAAAGKDPAAVAAELLTQVLTHGSGLTHARLLEISGDSYERFAASGKTDEQLSDELEAAKHAARAAKRGIPSQE